MTAPVEDTPDTVVTVPASPDPAIAPGTPDPADEAEPAAGPEDRWVRFTGPVTQTVGHVGEWVSGEVKHVTGWLAGRLLQHPHFVEAADPTDPTPDAEAEPEPEAAAEPEPAPAEATKPGRRARPAPGSEAAPTD